MNRSKNTSFADRLSAAAEAKKAQLERAARAKSEAESPAAVERRAAREAVRVARDARIAERRATKLAVEAREAAGHKACRDNRSVLYQRVPKLFGDLALARGDGRYARVLRSLIICGRVDIHSTSPDVPG